MVGREKFGQKLPELTILLFFGALENPPSPSPARHNMYKDQLLFSKGGRRKWNSFYLGRKKEVEFFLFGGGEKKVEFSFFGGKEEGINPSDCFYKVRNRTYIYIYIIKSLNDFRL